MASAAEWLAWCPSGQHADSVEVLETNFLYLILDEVIRI